MKRWGFLLMAVVGAVVLALSLLGLSSTVSSDVFDGQPGGLVASESLSVEAIDMQQPAAIIAADTADMRQVTASVAASSQERLSAESSGLAATLGFVQDRNIAVSGTIMIRRLKIGDVSVLSATISKNDLALRTVSDKGASAFAASRLSGHGEFALIT